MLVKSLSEHYLCGTPKVHERKLIVTFFVEIGHRMKETRKDVSPARPNSEQQQGIKFLFSHFFVVP